MFYLILGSLINQKTTFNFNMLLNNINAHNIPMFIILNSILNWLIKYHSQCFKNKLISNNNKN